MRLFVFIIPLLPLAWLVWQAFNAGLGANPIEKTLRHTGDWALNFLLLTLAVSPLRRITGWRWTSKIRRMTGLFAFFYASLHLATYVGLDQYFSWEAIAEDVVKNRRIIAGFAAYTVLALLTAASTKRLVERLGVEGWRRLHRLVYLAAAGGVVHYLWLVKKDLRTPLVYAAVLAALLALRAVLWSAAALKNRQCGNPEPSL